MKCLIQCKHNNLETKTRHCKASRHSDRAQLVAFEHTFAHIESYKCLVADKDSNTWLICWEKFMNAFDFDNTKSFYAQVSVFTSWVAASPFTMYIQLPLEFKAAWGLINFVRISQSCSRFGLICRLFRGAILLKNSSRILSLLVSLMIAWISLEFLIIKQFYIDMKV